LPVSNGASALAAANESRAIAIVAEPADLPIAHSRADTPILIGCPLPSARLWARRLGVAAYLSKPVSAEHLLRVLARISPNGHRVLVVDDDARFLQLIARILETSGNEYEIMTAQDGHKAMETLVEMQPDIVLLDLGLPDLNGREVIARKQADPRIAAIPVIVVSAPPAEDALAPIGERLEVFQRRGMNVEQTTRLLGAILGALSTGDTLPTEDRIAPSDSAHQ